MTTDSDIQQENSQPESSDAGVSQGAATPDSEARGRGRKLRTPFRRRRGDAVAAEGGERVENTESKPAEGKQTEGKTQTERKPKRGPRKLPDNLPVERVVEKAPCACGKCGGTRLRKLGETVTKTLECEPRRWKIVEHVREKFTCRDCDGITEPPAPSHPIPRGFAGPSLLAMVLVAKFLLHQPLNLQSATFKREGVEIDTSTLADRVGACVTALDPIVEAIRRHVLSAERLHADDSVLQKHAERMIVMVCSSVC